MGQSTKGRNLYFDLNLKQLRLFYYVGKHLSFTRAAEELHLTQPGIHMQIAQFERYYRVELFSRSKKTLSLTPAGEALFSYAERIMELSFEAEQLLLNIDEYPSGVLRIATTKTWARYLMPAHILLFQKRFPEVRIQLSEGSSEEMATSVVHGLSDVAIVARVAYDERLEVIPFPGTERDQLVLVVAPSHRLARRKKVEASELRGEHLILREKGSGTRLVISKHFEQRGVTPQVLLEASSVPFIKDLVAKGAGVSILTKVSIEEEVRSGALCSIPFADGGLWVPIDILVLKEGFRPPAVRSFLDFLTIAREQAGPK